MRCATTRSPFIAKTATEKRTSGRCRGVALVSGNGLRAAIAGLARTGRRTGTSYRDSVTPSIAFQPASSLPTLSRLAERTSGSLSSFGSPSMRSSSSDLRHLQVLQAGIDIGGAVAVQQLVQAKPLHESSDLARRHGLFLQIDELKHNAALLEEPLGGACSR